ncbi:MAG: CDP-2,3-bis-(O-geranylgeranyl)-sn-glycerol synthase [Thermoplasmataceae archaeon]
MPSIPIEILQSIIFFIPAYAANPGAVIFGGHWIMDGGKNFVDGRRILGDGKSWSGFLGGILGGVILGIILYIIIHYLFPGFGNFAPSLLSAIFPMIFMSIGSLAGDLFGSFTKRRLNIKRGQNASLLDQLPFVLMALLFLFIFSRGFFMAYYGNIVGALTVIILTPPLHRGINIIAYRMHMKDVPW